MSKLKRAIKLGLYPYFGVRDIKRTLNDIQDGSSKLDLANLVEQNNAILKAIRDDIPAKKAFLQQLRQTPEYSKVYDNPEPKVTIRIATYNRGEILMAKALPSALKQTYKNVEVVVVGDCCSDNTEQLIKKLNDKRVRFYNLPQRPFYPRNKYKFWLVVGSVPMNVGSDLATGDFIAPLDDDDEFSPDHVEKLVGLALANKAELAYGALESIDARTKKTRLVYSNPPRMNHFSFHGAMYLRLLHPTFRIDEQGWVMGEVEDWLMARRMLEAGVKYASTKDVVGTIHFTSIHEKEYE